MTIREIIQDRYGMSSGGFTRQDIMNLLRDTGSSFSDRYISFTLQNMLCKGEIERMERGRFHFPTGNKLLFAPHPSDTIRQLHADLKERFPFVDFCIWNTRDLFPLMHHVPNMQMLIVSCEKDTVASVAHSLANMTDRIVLPEPKRYDLENIALGREVIVVNTLVSQAPVMEVDGVPVPKLEKILVDILVEEQFSYLEGSESYRIFETAFSDYQVRQSMLLRYAGRRNRREQVLEILKENS